MLAFSGCVCVCVCCCYCYCCYDHVIKCAFRLPFYMLISLYLFFVFFFYFGGVNWTNGSVLLLLLFWCFVWMSVNNGRDTSEAIAIANDTNARNIHPESVALCSVATIWECILFTATCFVCRPILHGICTRVAIVLTRALHTRGEFRISYVHCTVFENHIRFDCLSIYQASQTINIRLFTDRSVRDEESPMREAGQRIVCVWERECLNGENVIAKQSALIFHILKIWIIWSRIPHTGERADTVKLKQAKKRTNFLFTFYFIYLIFQADNCVYSIINFVFLFVFIVL